MKKALVIVLAVAFLVGAGFSNQTAVEASSLADEIDELEIVVTYGAGGSTDVTVRQMEPHLEEHLGIDITISNVSGAAGLTGANYAHGTDRDDGSLMFTLVTTPAYFAPHTTPDTIEFDPRYDLTHIARVGQWRNDLAIRKDDDRFDNWEEFLEYSRENPGEVTVGLNGIGHTTHITMEWLSMQEDVDWTFVPYDSGSENVSALAGGHVDASASVVSWAGMEDEIEPIVAFDNEPIPGYEDVPYLQELGYDWTAPSLLSFAAPEGVPEDRVEELAEAIEYAVTQDDVLDVMGEYEMFVDFWPGEELQQDIEERYDVLGELMEEIGLAAE